MKFKELKRNKERLNWSIRAYGVTEEANRVVSIFDTYMGGHYNEEDFENTEFLETEVPSDVLDVFHPLETLLQQIEERE